MTAIHTFKGGATATSARDAVIKRLEQEIPGFRLEAFAYGNPCVWTVSFAGQRHEVSRAQVEVWVAAFRAGYAVGRGEVAQGDGERFAAHQFSPH